MKDIVRMFILLVAASILAACASGPQQTGFELSTPISDSGEISVEQAESSEVNQNTSDDSAPEADRILPLTNEVDGVVVGQDITGFSVLSYHNGEHQMLELDGVFHPDYSLPTYLDYIGIVDFFEGAALIEYRFGREAMFRYNALISLGENSGTVFALPRYGDGARSVLLKNGLIAASDGLYNQKISLYKPSGQLADVQLDFDYGKELTAHMDNSDFGAYYGTLGYEYVAESITYDMENEQYILVYTTSAWLNYELDTDLSPGEVWFAIFDQQGNEVRRFPISLGEFYLAGISKMRFYFGDTKLICIGDQQVLIARTPESYDKNYVVDLNSQQYREITHEEVEKLLNQLGLRYVFYDYIVESQPPCPFIVTATSDGLCVNNEEDRLIVELDASYLPFGYAVDADGTDYLYFVKTA